MILDSLDNARWYYPEAWWQELVDFIRQASPSLPDGEHLLHDGIVARVFSMQTKPKASCQLESHRASVDVQVVLAGHELISVWPVRSLTPTTEYDPARDVRFYTPPLDSAVAFPLQPGAFALFFPQDAHLTLQAPVQPAPIKKLVAKVPVGLFLTESSL